jgi:hypothetical protein
MGQLVLHLSQQHLPHGHGAADCANSALRTLPRGKALPIIALSASAFAPSPPGRTPLPDAHLVRNVLAQPDHLSDQGDTAARRLFHDHAE